MSDAKLHSCIGPPVKLSERVVRTAPLPAKGPISALLAGLRLGELPGLDTVPDNFVAAATLALAPAMAPPQQVCVHTTRGHDHETDCESCSA